MAPLELAACFGIELLGMCKYDPQAPSPSYFTIGDAVAALAFTLAVQQFLKPIYQFRLMAMGIRFSYVVITVFIGSACTVIAAAVPNVIFLRGTVLGHPVNWEIAGGILIGIAYAIVAIISLRPAIVTDRNLDNFTWAGAWLLSEATDEDRLNLARDLLSSHNIEKLVGFASAFERADQHAVLVELENLKDKGLEYQGVRGQPPVSAFYAFAKRRELSQARYAWHFLQLLSDKDFCRVVVTRYSWGFVGSIISFSGKGIYAESVRSFVQAVAWQALVQDESMLAKEDGYEGFARRKTFASEFFGNSTIRIFDPLGGISSMGDNIINKRFVSRLNIASQEMIKAELNIRGFWDHSSAASLSRIYADVANDVVSKRSKNLEVGYFFEYGRGVKCIIEILSEKLSNIDAIKYDLLFAKNIKNHRSDAIKDVSKIVCDSLNCVSNSFKGIEDPAWCFALDIFQVLFNDIEDSDIGLSPIQQEIAIYFVNKIRSNMNGYYPTLSCVLIALIGPYEANVPDKLGSAREILKNAIYYELKNLSNLFRNNPDKVIERLPPNVTYDHKRNYLTHKYLGGSEVCTDLNDSRIRKIDLFSEENLRLSISRSVRNKGE